MSSHVDCGLHPCYFFWHSFPDRQQIITTKKTILESFCFALRAIAMSSLSLYLHIVLIVVQRFLFINVLEQVQLF